MGCALWTRWVRPAEGWEGCGYWKGRPFGKHGNLIGMAKGISLTWRGHFGKRSPCPWFPVGSRSCWCRGAVVAGEDLGVGPVGAHG